VLDLLTGFFALLFLPLLGVLGLMGKRAEPLLIAVLFAWTAFGAIGLASGYRLGESRERFLQSWLLGLALCGAFLLVAHLRRKRRIAAWVKLGMAVVTLAVFLRALSQYVGQHA
jgi:hypothetical protein